MKQSSGNCKQDQTILMKEFSTYEILPLYSGTNILNWWKSHTEMLPVLSKLARLYLAIPATSTQSERVFSASGSSSRSTFEPGKVEGLVVINKNKTILKEYKMYFPIN